MSGKKDFIRYHVPGVNCGEKFADLQVSILSVKSPSVSLQVTKKGKKKITDREDDNNGEN